VKLKIGGLQRSETMSVLLIVMPGAVALVNSAGTGCDVGTVSTVCIQTLKVS
jgi:hypothetical protein